MHMKEFFERFDGSTIDDSKAGLAEGLQNVFYISKFLFFYDYWKFPLLPIYYIFIIYFVFSGHFYTFITKFHFYHNIRNS